MNRFLLALAAAGAVTAGAERAAAQSLKAELVGEPTIGKTAPNIVLPYVVGPNPGPADQPFRLGAELGRITVLFFGGVPSDASRPGWVTLVGRADSVRSPRVQYIGVVAAARAAVGAWSAGLGGRLKLLADSAGLVHRQFGVRPRDGWRVLVVADDGRLISVDRRPNLASVAWWTGLDLLVRQGVTSTAK